MLAGGVCVCVYVHLIRQGECRWSVLPGARWCLESPDWRQALSQSLLDDYKQFILLALDSSEQLEMGEGIGLDEQFWKLLATEPKPIM